MPQTHSQIGLTVPELHLFKFHFEESCETCAPYYPDTDHALVVSTTAGRLPEFAAYRLYILAQVTEATHGWTLMLPRILLCHHVLSVLN